MRRKRKTNEKRSPKEKREKMPNTKITLFFRIAKFIQIYSKSFIQKVCNRLKVYSFPFFSPFLYFISYLLRQNLCLRSLSFQFSFRKISSFSYEPCLLSILADLIVNLFAILSELFLINFGTRYVKVIPLYFHGQINIKFFCKSYKYCMSFRKDKSLLIFWRKNIV